MSAAVLGVRRLGRRGVDRLLLAEGHGAQTLGRDAQAHQIVPCRPGPLLPEGEDAAAATDIPDTSSLTSSGEGGPLADIRFDLDSATLDESARATLDGHAVWLQSHRDTRVTVEGHCDARGTVEYNLALGDQRARAARDYLVSLGVAADRLRAVSFGKEQPVDPAPTEEAYAQNRRAHFAVER